MVRVISFAILCVAVMTSRTTFGEGFEPLARPLENANLSPFMMGLLLPTTAPASILGRGESDWSVATHWISNFVEDRRGNRAAVGDGETFIGSLRYARGFGDFEVGIDLPYVRHSGGFLDSIIVDWHDFFGLPQGGRDVVPDGRLLFELREANSSILLDSPSKGFGGAKLHIARALEIGKGTTAGRLTIKLPTGELDEFTGTGGVDVSASIHHDRNLTGRFSIGGWLGASRLSLPDDRRDIARQAVFGGGIVVRMIITPAMVLKAQWASHSPVYDSELSVLRHAPGILSFGGSVRLSSRDVVDIAVLENWPNGDTSPDFSFGFTWRRSS